MPRTVVFHPGALGDVLLAIPALRALRARAGELLLAAQPHVGRLLAALGVVDRHVAFDTLGVETLFADGPLAERLERQVSGARIVSWFGHADAGFATRLRRLDPRAIVASSKAPIGSTVWRHLLATIESTAEDREPIAVPRALADDGRRALVEAGWDGARPLLALHPGAGGAPKRWAVEGFAAAAERLAETLGADVVVHDGPADHEAAAALRARLPALHLAEPSLETLAGALRHAALWLGNDSGVTHLAAASGAPTVALFMSSNLAWRPWARHARVRVVSAGTRGRADVDAVVAEATAALGSGEIRVGSR